MAGSATWTKKAFQSTPDESRGIVKYTIDWTSDASGDMDSSSTEGDIGEISGELVRVDFNPGATAPSANYGIVLNDEQAIDVLAGQGANLSATVTTSVCPGVALKDGTTTSVIPMAVCGDLDLVVSNAGNAKQGAVVLYVR